jgi:hypothetical protein
MPIWVTNIEYRKPVAEHLDVDDRAERPRSYGDYRAHPDFIDLA